MRAAPHTLIAPDAFLNDRCCLTCGFRGRELQGRRGLERLVCPRCRQDLCARPARSYAELEGLVERAASATRAPVRPAGRRIALLRLAGGILGVGLMLVRSKAGQRRGRGTGAMHL